ncbi:unnamed protein product [Angiostrongylus costaricensis]|uniref:RING-type domain-containing protein n=1 Tax=Angiostrongylus costaricensis TaxID=334426 RepID=A0A0R3PIR6_ANGCS|nr:unnamed protein product [Angiostrongylus costaricensis]
MRVHHVHHVISGAVRSSRVKDFQNENRLAFRCRRLPSWIQGYIKSPYVNQLYVANVARQRAAADENKLREDAQRQRVKRLLEQIPADEFHSDMRSSECAICMVDFECGEKVRFLPCMHSFHQTCVDDWLMRSFTCPSCLEPVDSTILSSLTAHTQQSFRDLACSPAIHGKPLS